MAKMLSYGEEARQALERGVNKLADTIRRRCGEDAVTFQIFDGWNHCALNHIVTRDWFMKANLDRVFGFLDRVM